MKHPWKFVGIALAALSISVAIKVLLKVVFGSPIPLYVGFPIDCALSFCVVYITVRRGWIYGGGK